MTEQELREMMRGKLDASGLNESVDRITEILLDTYGKGVQDGMDIAAGMYNEKLKH